MPTSLWNSNLSAASRCSTGISTSNTRSTMRSAALSILVEFGAVQNPYLRAPIDESRELVHAA